MFTVDVSCLVDRPLLSVFDFVADFRNAPTWQPQLDEVRLDDGPFPDGTTVTEIHHFFGVQVQARGNLVEWDPPRGFVVRGRSRLLAVESRYSFEREGDGTRSSLSLTMRPRGPALLAEPMLRRQVTADLRTSFANLATTLLAELKP